MRLVDDIHSSYVHTRRIRVLAEVIAPRLPQGASVLDIGCGDGRLGSLIAQLRPDISIEGIDVLVRPALIPVRPFDGSRIPCEDRSVDVAMLVDVLHHTTDPVALLGEAARVARQGALIKDHLADGFLARPTLRFMDRVGNRRYGVALPYNYLSRSQWQSAFATLDLRADSWDEKLPLYPWWASWAFGRGLHFVALLRPRHSISCSDADVAESRIDH